MKFQSGAIISVLVLMGCAQDYLATGLPLLQGHPVSQAIHYLGPPTQEKKASGTTTYTWVNNQSGTFYVPDTATYPVVVTGSGGHPTVAFTGTSPPPMPDTYDWHCRLDITADKGVIAHTSYQGDTAGCQKFSEKLKPLVTAAEGQ